MFPTGNISYPTGFENFKNRKKIRNIVTDIFQFILPSKRDHCVWAGLLILYEVNYPIYMSHDFKWPFLTIWKFYTFCLRHEKTIFA